MDPVGPWSAYASYNRLAGVQAGAAGGDFHHHLTGSGSTLAGHNPAGGVPSTTSQLLLQAAHTTASLAGQLGSSTAPFNPGGFLSPPPVAYDAVFSPLFHHSNPKPAHYSSTINAQHRQALVQAQAAAASKQASVESELSTLRENYTSHHQSLAAAQGSTFFDQSAAPGSASGLAWQGNNQLPSPFGILPHESVVPSSPSPATTKSSSSAAYENFNVHFAAAQINNHISSQLVANANKAVRSASPQVTQPVKPVPSQASASVTAGTFFQTSATFGNSSENISSYSTSNAKSGPISTQQEYATSGKQRANSTAPTPPAASHQSPASSISSPQEIATKVPDKKITVPAIGAGSSFMASYLKFLQGERDTSPPPATRGGRKATWSRSNNANNKAYNDQINSKIVDHQNLQTSQNSNGTMANSGTSNSNVSMNTTGVLSPVGNINSSGNITNPGSLNTVGVMSPGNMMPSMPTVAKTIEGPDDSRYFSVPKDRKRKFDGLDDGFDANDDEARRINKPVLNVPSTPLNEKGKKGRTNINKTPAVVASPQGSNGPKKPRPAVQPSLPVMQAQSHQQYYYQQPDEGAFNFLDYHYRNRQRW